MVFAEYYEKICTPLSVNVSIILAQSNVWNTIVKLFFKHSALPRGVTLNRNYSSWKSACPATLWQLKALYMSSEYIYIRFQSCKAIFETLLRLAVAGNIVFCINTVRNHYKLPLRRYNKLNLYGARFC
jgi:hypothetical protein